MYSIKGVWFQHSTDLIPEIPISKCPQARIFSGEKAGRIPLLGIVMDIFERRGFGVKRAILRFTNGMQMRLKLPFPSYLANPSPSYSFPYLTSWK
jgi:hypothetical protein